MRMERGDAEDILQSYWTEVLGLLFPKTENCIHCLSRSNNSNGVGWNWLAKHTHTGYFTQYTFTPLWKNCACSFEMCVCVSNYIILIIIIGTGVAMW